MLRFAGKTLSEWKQSHPLLLPLSATEELLWLNPQRQTGATALEGLPLGAEDSAQASARLQRFAPLIAELFPETREQEGIIESPLCRIEAYQSRLQAHYQSELRGELWLKCDNQLPISGSIKARGGIYEVLKYAEQVAIGAGFLTLDESYLKLMTAPLQQLFQQHQIVVGSTGNLGLSIGIMGAALGFQVTVHMSADARQWKKDLLRSKGVSVIEYADDYSKAVEEGRRQAARQPNSHFVDDENSTDLFLGYSVAAERLKAQLDEAGVKVDAEHPLFVYLPCGVGGGPGGVAFGLKLQFGDHVHCFFAEPTHSPCMLLGMYTGLHDEICVQDLGIDNKTCADGLAVGRASGFVGRVMEPLLSGVYTVDDAELYRLLALLYQSEKIALEPSALAGVPGAVQQMGGVSEYIRNNALAEHSERITHLVWATGGSMVPPAEWQAYNQQGLELLAK